MRSGGILHARQRLSGLRTLVVAEAFERHAYCGTQLLLALYLGALFASGSEDGARLIDLVAGWSGTRDPVAVTAQVMGLFFASTHLATLAGAWLARRVDRRMVVALGGTLMTVGHFAMAYPAMLLPALAMLVAGAGCTVSNKLTQVGLLYRDRDGDPAQGFATYTIGLNIGVLSAPLICGTLGEVAGWAWGFRAAGVSMAIGLACYVAGWRTLPAETRNDRRPDAPRTSTDRKRVVGAVIALLPYVVIVAVVNQAYTVVLAWASTAMSRTVMGVSVPLSWLLVVDGVGSIVALMLTKHVWRRQAARGRSWRDLTRVSIGCGLLMLAYGWLALAAAAPQVALLSVIGFFLVLVCAVAWIDVPFEAWLSRHLALRDAGTGMAMFKASSAVGALLLAWLGRFYQSLGASGFWMLNAGLALIALVAVLIVQAAAERVSAAASRREPPLPPRSPTGDGRPSFPSPT